MASNEPSSSRQDGSPLARGPQQWSISQARRLLTQSFHDTGLETPELDARLLVSHALGLDHAGLAARADTVLTAAETEDISALAARRLAHEPVARIIGVKEFWGLPFRLNSETLVPRPDTETVVEAALAGLDRTRSRTQPLSMADLGTGSGALALALLSELPAARATATDLSFGALTCARENAAALGLARRINFIISDYGSALRGPFDLVVCNPPYVSRGEIDKLAPEVRIYDPTRALDGGPDGLSAYRALARDARRLLAPSGTFVLELGIGQFSTVSAFFAAAGLAVEPPRCDLAGVARALVVKAPP